jgi:hypothetical protein
VSEQIKDGGSAFPWRRDRGQQEAWNAITSGQGMSLLDYFAIRATEKDIASHIHGNNGHPIILNREQARYAFARAMLAAREAKS